MVQLQPLHWYSMAGYTFGVNSMFLSNRRVWSRWKPTSAHTDGALTSIGLVCVADVEGWGSAALWRSLLSGGSSEALELLSCSLSLCKRQIKKQVSRRSASAASLWVLSDCFCASSLTQFNFAFHPTASVLTWVLKWSSFDWNRSGKRWPLVTAVTKCSLCRQVLHCFYYNCITCTSRKC